MHVQHSTVNNTTETQNAVSLKTKMFTNITHRRRPHSTHPRCKSVAVNTNLPVQQNTLTTVGFRTSQVSPSPSLLRYPRSCNFFICISEHVLLLWFVLTHTQKNNNKKETLLFPLSWFAFCEFRCFFFSFVVEVCFFPKLHKHLLSL